MSVVKDMSVRSIGNVRFDEEGRGKQDIEPVTGIDKSIFEG